MNNAARTEAAREKAAEPRKPQNPEALRAQEQKVTHDKVVQYLYVTIRQSSSSSSRPLVVARKALRKISPDRRF